MADDQAEIDPLRYFRTDWGKVIQERFPNGVMPVETPFLSLMKDNTKRRARKGSGA